MMSVLCFILAALMPLRPIWAAEIATSTVGSKSPSNHQYRIHHSHMFHVEPRALISSVLSDVRRQPILQDDGGGSLVDIDVSSTRLDDAAAVSLVKELMSLLKSKINEADDSQSETRAPLLIKLALAMNKLTPSGVSNLIDALIKKETNEINMESDSEETNDMVEAPSNGLNNETIDEQAANDATLGGLTSNDTSQGATTPLLDAPSILVEELDLSFNDIGGHGIHSPNVQMLDSVRRLFEGDGAAFIPRIISLENCGIGPAFCRSVGRGILNAFERKNSGAYHAASQKASERYRPSVLRIGGNKAIGDAGTVALAAALRMATGNDSGCQNVLEELDLSSCDVGDAGAEALALAIASNPGCLSRLDLSNNKITDAGSKALGRALVEAAVTSPTIFESIILDNNDIGDDGAAALSEALSCGAVKSISMRSCSIQAQGTASFGEAVVLLANRNSCKSSHFHIDLSGNHFGTRKIKKKKSIRDKASTNIKFIGKTLKGAAKRFSSETMGISADSDDDEEIMGGLIDDEAEEIDGNKIQACGGHAFAGEILRGDQKEKTGSTSLKISVGMRQCRLDDGAIDALSASIVSAKNCEVSIDISLNTVEDNVVDALMNAKDDSKLLASMARRHMDFLDRLAAAETTTRDGSLFDNDEFYDIGFDYDPSDDFE